MKFAHNIFQGRAITMDCQDYITELVERKKGQHLQREERGAIQHLKNAGYTNRAIARAIGCSPTTVGNELKRGTPPRKSSKGRKPGYSARRGEAAYSCFFVVILMIMVFARFINPMRPTIAMNR